MRCGWAEQVEDASMKRDAMGWDGLGSCVHLGQNPRLKFRFPLRALAPVTVPCYIRGERFLPCPQNSREAFAFYILPVFITCCYLCMNADAHICQEAVLCLETPHQGHAVLRLEFPHLQQQAEAPFPGGGFEYRA